MDCNSKENDIDITTLIKDIQEEIGEVGNTEPKKEASFKLLNLFKSNKIAPDTFLDDLESENTKNYNFLKLSESKKLEEDIKQMRLEFKNSQEFFASARDSLESINFEKVKHRIKDLHLYPNNREVDEIFGNLKEKKDFNKNLSKLTKVMGDKFKDHPGEFADIPEISSFFKACTQLQKGLDDLDKKKSDFTSLGKRIIWATNVSENRSKDIQKMLSEQRKLSVSLQQKEKE